MRPPAKRYQDLEIWQKGHKLAIAVYKATASMPKSEEYGLKSQMRRAAVSIPANIAEGFRRRTPRDKCHFLTIALCSLMELEYFFFLAPELGMLAPGTLEHEIDELARMLAAAEATLWEVVSRRPGAP